MNKEFKGRCKGVQLKKRGFNDEHIAVQIITEDDGTWHNSGSMFSSYWIDDLIEQLQNAKKFIESQTPDIYEGKQYGYKFKNIKNYL